MPEGNEGVGLSPPATTAFVRCIERGRFECALQTAVVTFSDPGGRTVTLVAAFHDASPGHFRRIERTLSAYPLVLYEGWRREVADGPGENTIPEPAPLELAMDISGAIVTQLWDLLEFEFVGQWEGSVGYDEVRFRNADMMFSEFAQRCFDEGEVYRQAEAALAILRPYILSVLLLAVPSTWEAIDGSRSIPEEWRAALRVLYTRQTAVANNLLAAYNARPDVARNVTIHARNQVVVDALAEELEKGHEKIAIYYGAVHMPDLERRIVAQGFSRTRIEWLDCWSVNRARRR